MGKMGNAYSRSHSQSGGRLIQGPKVLFKRSNGRAIIEPSILVKVNGYVVTFASTGKKYNGKILPFGHIFAPSTPWIDVVKSIRTKIDMHMSNAADGRRLSDK